MAQAQTRVADLPTTESIESDSYVIIEKPGVGSGTYKGTVGQLQSAITVEANVTKQDNEVKIHIKDINGTTEETIVYPTATITDNHDGTSTITITDVDGTTTSAVVNLVTIDPEPTEGSNNMISSGTIYDILQSIDSRLASLEETAAQSLLLEDGNIDNNGG